MAGYFGAGLEGALQGYNAALSNQPAQVARILALKGEMQRQAILNKQLQDQQMAGQALLSYYGTPQTPAPSMPSGAPAPSPGQASVPSVVATGNMPSWAMPQPSAQPAPQPTAPAQGVGPAGIMPYKSMSDIVQEVRQKMPGASPGAIMAAAGQIAKGEQAQSTEQLRYATLWSGLQEKQAALEMRKQDLEFRMRDAEQRHQDTTAYRDALLGLRSQALQNQRQMIQMRREMWGFGGAGGSVIPASDQGKTGEEFLKTLSPADAAQVKALDEGRLPVSVYSLRSPGMRVLVERTMQYDPNFDATTYQTRQAVRRDFTSGQTARNITALNTAIGHLGTVYELGKELQTGNVRAANRLYQRIATETGSAQVNNFELARNAVANELTRVFRQVGASEQETREWASTIMAANSPAQLQGAARTVVDLLHSRIQALNDQWNRGMNTDKGFPNIVSPKSERVLSEVLGASSLAPVNAKGWKLMQDSRGNYAYVSPDGKQVEDVSSNAVRP